MNALGGSPLEMAVILVAVLMLFGANALPGALRTLGRWSEQLRRISRELQREIADAGEPVSDVKREWDEAVTSVRQEQSDSDGFGPRPEAPPEEVDEAGAESTEEDLPHAG